MPRCEAKEGVVLKRRLLGRTQDGSIAGALVSRRILGRTFAFSAGRRRGRGGDARRT